MKMKKRQQCYWSDLPVELLELVALKLSVPDVARFKSVCSSWNKAAKGINSRGPFLMRPSSEETTEQRLLQFFNVRDGMKVVYTAKSVNLEKLLDDGRCIGSSHGWLAILDKLANPWLLNPFSGKEIGLPKWEKFPEIEKAIISSNPSYDKNYKVIIINGYGHGTKLAFCNVGDYEWTVLCNRSRYEDAVWHDNMLYALAEGEGFVVWDFHEDLLVPTKRIVLSPSCLQKNITFEVEFQYYLAISMGEILVIERYIEDLEDGKFVDQADEDGNPVWPYRTLKFKIFKLDLIQQTLSELKSLQDQALFVGGNHTISLCIKDFVGLQKDSIYFTDNNSFRLDLHDDTFGGHDMGIFNLETESVDMFSNSAWRIEPIPHWVSTL